MAGQFMVRHLSYGHMPSGLLFALCSERQVPVPAMGKLLDWQQSVIRAVGSGQD
jgi:hypothetical protein